MKILYLDYDDLKNPFANGGQAYTASELAPRLAKKHKITVVTGNYPNAKRKTSKGVFYERLGVGNFGYVTSLLSFWLLMPFYVLLNQRKYDVIVECFTGPFTTSFVPFVSKKPLVGVAHFFDSQKLAQKYKLPLDIFQKKFIQKYSNIIALTDQLKKRITSLNPQVFCVVIPGGVQKDLLTSKFATGEYALYLGRIDIYNKCLDLLLEAWVNIDEKLVIAGSGKESESTKLKELIDKMGISHKVKFIGRVNGKRKIELYRKSKFVLQPSRYETFGYVALETLASGKYLICFDIPGFSWLPKSGVLRIKKIYAKNLEKGIRKTLSTKYVNEGKKNRAFAKKFDWDKIAKKYDEMFQKVV